MDEDHLSYADWQKFSKILSLFKSTGTSISQFLLAIIKFNQQFNPTYTSLVDDLFKEAVSIFNAFSHGPESLDTCSQWAQSLSLQIYMGELCRLTDKASGMHFNAAHATAVQIKDFASGNLKDRICTLAPSLWRLFQGLLASDGDPQINGDQAMKAKIFNLKAAMHISSLMFANNKQCNLLAAINGLFLHTCNASERVIDALWRMDASISASAVNKAIKSLSIETNIRLKEIGRSFLVGYTLDNYDVSLKRSTGTIERPISSLEHLTSGLVLNLAHTSIDDHKWSTFLWERTKFNDMRKYPLTTYSPSRLFDLHFNHNPEGSLNHKESFCCWKFAVDLCTDGPVYFRQFLNQIPPPDGVEAVPLFKTESVPLKSMRYMNSTVDGNIKAIMDAMIQTGVWNIEENSDIPDVEEIVIFIHGDNGTWDKIQAARYRRQIERTSRERLQFIVFIPGLFHIKIACADAIWRIFISPPDLRRDETSMFAFIQLFYPSLTSKILSNKAGFHVLNDCIVRVGVADRLECWRALVHEKWPECDTLEKYVARKPSLQDILSLSMELARKYSSSAVTLENLRFGTHTTRDYQFENTLVRIDYILLYEELAHSIRCGDIGRIELCLRRWIPIFKGVGKHKYASSLLEFMIDVHFVYPEGLKKAVRYNWLCNPTGKPMGFRGVDWLLELYNQLTKVIYGGSSSNYTISRIIEESVLIQLYRDCKKVIEDQYHLTPKTTRHGDPDLVQTYAALSRLAQSVSLLTCLPGGRVSESVIPNYFGLGMAKFHSELIKASAGATLTLLEDEEEVGLTEEDLLVEE